METMRKLEQDKRGITGGLLMSIAGGVVSFVIFILISFVFIDTIVDANLLTADSASDNATDRLVANYTAGVDQISGKIPTVMLIAAVVLLFAVLLILAGIWSKMKLGGESI